MVITNPLRLWHLTSLDAPTVAVTWLLAFAWAGHLHLPLWLSITLALITWSAYIADRLLDARKSLPANGCSLSHRRVPQVSPLRPGFTNLRPRHIFHWQHRKLFLPIAILSTLAALALLHQNMPPAARERNSLLAAAALLYFTSVHTPWRPASSLRIPKELLVGILFTLACTLPTLGRISSGHTTLFAPILAFIALAWLNCHAIELWESTSHSILLPAITLTLTTLPLAAANYHHPRIALLLLCTAASSALLACLELLEHRIHPTTQRALADLVLLTPLPLLLIAN